jgi:orotidine-5'-phosphate decarboxylase
MKALEKLQRKNREGKFICVGLDSDLKKIPSFLNSEKQPLLHFNKEIINKTLSDAAAYKINFAFYEKEGPKGFEILSETISLIPDDILIIGDAKRGDIGNTSQMYASAIFDFFKCDASTVNPFMGEDSVLPFLENEDKLNFILALTSNPGSHDFEKLKLSSGLFLYQKVIERVKEWNRKKNCGIVFGATNADELKDNIKLIDDLPVLLPGVGSQGGDIEKIIKVFKESGRNNFLVNVSRGIIYKSNERNFAEAAGEELISYNKKINEILNKNY